MEQAKIILGTKLPEYILKELLFEYEAYFKQINLLLPTLFRQSDNNVNFSGFDVARIVI